MANPPRLRHPSLDDDSPLLYAAQIGLVPVLIVVLMLVIMIVITNVMVVMPSVFTMVISRVGVDVRLVILRNIDVSIPVILHEIHRSGAGIVSITILAPVLGLPGRHAQVHRGQVVIAMFDDHRLTVDHRRPTHVAKLQLPVEPGLSHRNPDSYVSGQHRSDAKSANQRQSRQQFVHVSSPFSKMARSLRLSEQRYTVTLETFLASAGLVSVKLCPYAV
jgi:hypothetical protein